MSDELRKKAREALGDRFDIRGFHDVAPGSGAAPLSISERIGDRPGSRVDNVR